MTPDQLEFAISQYLDGTLAADEQAALERHLETDAGARQMLAEYRAPKNYKASDCPLCKAGTPITRF